MASTTNSHPAIKQESNGTEGVPSVGASSDTDLFVGELFGDELIDIYNAAVEQVENADHDTSPPSDGVANQDNAGDMANHPGAMVAATAAALDNGLPPFGTSNPAPFNDTAPPVSQGTEKSRGEVPPPKVESLPAAPVGPTPAEKPNSHGLKRKAEAALGTTGASTTQSPTPSAAVVSAPVSATKSSKKSAAQVKAGPNAKAQKTTTKATKPDKKSKPASANAKASRRASSASTGSKNSEESGSECGGTTTRAGTSEADFKSVAKEAVSNLIESTKNGGGEGAVKVERGSNEPIDTSTEHIKALTGSNWVTACAGAGAAAVAAAGSDAPGGDGSKSNNRSKRQNMSADERARQNRDRNRNHARNTRLRKKAYVEELKRTLTELVAQRERAEQSKKQAAQREKEQREVRFRVIEEFLKLRGRNEPNAASWSAILQSSFSLTTPCDAINRKIVGDNVDTKLECTFSGVPEVMKESSNFASFLQSIGSAPGTTPVALHYTCDRKNFFMDDNRAVLDWSATTIGLVERGLESELSMRGSVGASFCPASNKLLSANLMFDTGMLLQLQQETVPASTTCYSDTQAASNRANAILESIEMPHMAAATGAAIVHGDSSDEGA